MFKLFQRKPQLEPQPTFTQTLTEIESFKQLVKDSKCLGCGQSTLKLQMFARGPEGWEAEVSCTNCPVHGIVNQQGFTFKGLEREKDGKAIK